MEKSTRRAAAAGMSVALALAILPVISATASGDAARRALSVEAPAAIITPIDPTKEMVDELVLPALTVEQADWLTRAQAELEKDDRFASLRISDDRKTATLTWFGPQDVAIDNLLKSSPAGTAVQVASAPFLPGDLRRLALQILGADLSLAGLSVTSTRANEDGSGVTVGIDGLSSRITESLVRTAITTALGQTNIPIALESNGGVIPSQNRQDDTFHIGGARIYNNSAGGTGCTTGFAVKRPSGKQGMMFAAHCGTINQQIIRTAGLNSTTAYYYGNIAQRTTASDGAIVENSSASYLYQGALYVAGYNQGGRFELPEQ